MSTQPYPLSDIKDTNPLIRRHLSLQGAPNPDDYENPDDFIKAHRMWLNELRLENAEATYKLMSGIRKEKDSFVLAYLTGILHIRKEYARYLTNGIDACHILLGSFEI